ncbi:MAG: DUF5694 domain-containing protein [Flavobacteriales bacterium]
MFARGVLTCSLALAVSFPLLAQQRQTLDPDAILIGNQPQAHILLVGTFHFSYPGLDAHKTTETDQVDVLSPQRQKELAELVDVIMRFRPNKIAMETEGGALMRQYRTHQAEGTPLGRNEYYQLGFRIMDLAKMDTLYAVDAEPLVNDLYDGPDSLRYRPWLDSLYAGWDWGGEDTISKRYSEFYHQQDLFERDHTLLESFLASNDDHTLDRGFGAYLHGGFELDDQRGADVLSIHWYNRNLRIFRKIQGITTSPDDRILVLFGAGHMGILKHLFECSPQYKRVRLSELVEH